MDKKNFIKHFCFSLALALLFRLFSAYFVFGPQALDDYLNQLIPSYKFAEIGIHDLPAWRSPFIIWIFSGALKFLTACGIHSPVSQVQFLYVFIGLLSLTALVGTYLFFSAIEEYEIGTWALYFCALHGLMPFASTRAFLESIAIGPLTLGVGLLLNAVFKANGRKVLLAFLCIGVATLIRFQVGVIYVAATFWILVFHRRWWKETVTSAIIIAFANIAIESLDHRTAFSTLFAYLKVNENVSRYGSEPWYATWLTWLAIGFFPLSLPLLGKVKALNKKGLREVLFFVLVFVLAHSLVAHKEERFLYPILALSLWLWAALWVAAKDSSFFNRYSRPTLLVFNFLILGVSCFFNTQVGEIGVPARMSSDSQRVLYLDRESLVGLGQMREFFIRSGSEFKEQTHSISMNEITDQMSSKKYEAIAVMTSQPDRISELKSLNDDGDKEFQCSRVYQESSLVDSVIYALNPRHNVRRRPTWYVVCSDSHWLEKHDFQITSL